jgi:metallo-beta-lactamase class B
MELTLGETTLRLYLTPGHTPGTISTLIPVRDGNDEHLAAVWGGNGFGTRHFADPLEAYRAYSASANRFTDIVAETGVDVVLSSHTNHDKTLNKLNALRFRNSGDPHPFVDREAVLRHLTLVGECADAQVSWAMSSTR